MPGAVKGLFRRRWQRWLDRRIPRVTEVTLDQRRIFIFLSRQGGIASLVLVALFIGGINYANNLLLGLCFFLGSLFVITIHHTYANLSGLRIAAVTARPAFVGEDASFVLRFDDARGRAHESLLIEWEGVSLPVIGRVSMDLTALDCSAAPALAEGDWVAIAFDLPFAAGETGLSQYELLTGLGVRFDRAWR